MNESRNGIIFDGDDTLWHNQTFYDEAKEQFYGLMQEQGFTRQEAKSKFAKVDVLNVQKLGFSRERFPRSMQETYECLASQHGLRIDPLVTDEAKTIGCSVFNRAPVLLADVEPTLSLLKPTYTLCLYTAGDPHIQQEKLGYLGITHYFDHVGIVERKSDDQLRCLLQQMRLSNNRTWMVGNSLRSDINPALRLGLRCIWLRTTSWEYDEEELLSGQLWQVAGIAEIPSVLAEVDQALLVQSP